MTIINFPFRIANFPSIISNDNSNSERHNVINNTRKEINTYAEDETNENRIEEIYQEIYQKYGNNSNKTTKAYKKLNKIKVYFIAKSVEKEGRKTIVPIPINNFDDLSNTVYAKSLNARVGTFQMRTRKEYSGEGLIEGTSGNRQLVLQHVLSTKPPYFGISDVPLSYLTIPDLDELRTDHVDDYGELEPMPSEEKLKELDEKANFTRLLSREATRPDGVRFIYRYYLDPYEYDDSFLDNTIFGNTEPYLTDPRDRKNFNRTFKEILNNIKNIKLEDIWNNERKELYLRKIEDLVYRNTDELASKHIIPVFSDIEEAQKLLLATLEDVLEPFKNIRCFEDSTNSENYPLTNVDYIDDSLTFENKYNVPETTIEKYKDRLTRYRFRKPHTNLMPQYENYQLFDPFEEEEPNFEFLDHFGLIEITEKNLEPKQLSEFDTLVLGIASETKIVSMGLADFLNFWNNNTIKNGEVLFMPSSEDFRKMQLPLLPKKRPIDRFYEYQQKFRGDNKANRDEYVYEIKS